MVKARFSPIEVKAAVREFAKALESHNIKVRTLILFGSYASGKVRDFSDIDLAVISPNFSGRNRLEIQELIAMAIKGRQGTAMAIDPIGYAPSEYSEAKKESFLGEIKQTGKRIF
jgi:uncharacterized protein